MAGDDPRLRYRQDAVRAVVRDVLGDDTVELDDNFFTAGGDSMRSLQVIEGLARRGLAIEVADVLTAQTLGQLARCARVPVGPEAAGAGSPASGPALAPPAGASAIRPASGLQVGMLFLTEMAGPSTGIYVDFCGVRVSGAVEPGALRTALARVVARHESLRSYFDLASYPVAAQIVLPHATVAPEWSALGERDDARAVIARWRQQVVDEGIDTAAAPPLRCHVGTAPDHFWLTLATHHSVLDGWSFTRLMVDLLLHYDAAMGGTTAELPDIPSGGGAEFVRLERKAINSPAAQRYWRRHTEGAPRPVPGAEVARASRQLVAPLHEPAWAGLTRTAAALQVPVKSLCLAAHARAVGSWRGAAEVVTGLVTNGRPEIDGADLLVGLFLNTVPLALRTGGGWPEIARAALDAEREMYPYRRYPLATMTSDAGGPLFDVTFNFTHLHVVGELERLASVAVAGWWTEDVATFPVMVDVFTEDPMLGTGAMVSYDPDQVSPTAAQALLDELRAALLDASTAAVPAGSSGE
ncbi:MAG: hypothetical protein V7637_1947 [Mycobacteriales bacterium]